ncbi:hypothetical protein DCAR_0727900 [Daucus carota subsp. sativus]|uniref:Uncharacterized protein n=1 Tax=Daucus carota subsp. sativus TaxID=79200 RepID=A0A164TFW2_DAUCS|nr:hypothetical protein DCAR_0727900 [Daucus carota subsp. sativus]
MTWDMASQEDELMKPLAVINLRVKVHEDESVLQASKLVRHEGFGRLPKYRKIVPSLLLLRLATEKFICQNKCAIVWCH